MNIINKTYHIWQLTAVFLFVLLALPLSAQEKEDSLFTFRFLSGKDMFYAPGMNNGSELTRMYETVDRYKDLITDHEVMLHVNGYYIPKGSAAHSRAVAKTRSNRVKSELIVRKGLKEDNFITRNQEGTDNYVTVSFYIPLKYLQPEPVEEPQPEPEKEPQPEPVPPVVEEEIVVPEEDEIDEQPDIVVETVEEAPAEQPEPVIMPVDRSEVRPDSRFALKTNLLGYPVLMPNLEVEWMFVDRWSVALEGQRAWYAKNSPHKVYRLATVIPEVRYWVIDRSRWHGMYVGAFGGGGLYDLSDGRKGHEGEGYMAGLSAGYMWPIGKHLSLDAGIGVGYLHIRDKEYKPVDGHFLYQLTKNINYVGPLRLKLSLVWRIPSKKIQSVK